MTISAEKLRQYLLELPEVEQRETWGHPTFRVQDKLFASLPDDATAIVKTTPAEQAELIADDPKVFAVAPRVGRYGWVTVQLRKVGAEHMRELARAAWRRTAPQRLVQAHAEMSDG